MPRTPFRLVTAPAHNYLNSSFTETPTSIAKEERGPPPSSTPATRATSASPDGDRIRIGNRRGSVLIHARIANGKGRANGTGHGQQRGTVIVESIWPNTAFEEGLGINTLTSAEPGYPNGGAVFHDTAIWARPANLASRCQSSLAYGRAGDRRQDFFPAYSGPIPAYSGSKWVQSGPQNRTQAVAQSGS